MIEGTKRVSTHFWSATNRNSLVRLVFRTRQEALEMNEHFRLFIAFVMQYCVLVKPLPPHRFHSSLESRAGHMTWWEPMSWRWFILVSHENERLFQLRQTKEPYFISFWLVSTQQVLEKSQYAELIVLVLAVKGFFVFTNRLLCSLYVTFLYGSVYRLCCCR